MPNTKNGGKPPIIQDIRTKYVPVGCGNCIECRKQKARAWQVRLNEEIKIHNCKYFVTLTFSEENLEKLCKEIHTSECNAIAGIAIRRFLERWRKKHKKSLKHWLITELGHTGTERIHIHGLIFSDKEITQEKLQKYWSYGYADTGKYVNSRTISYIIKYVTKIDNDHKQYKAEIFCSAGLGKNYLSSRSAEARKYKPLKTIEYYTLPNGQKVNLPIYYRNKLFTEEEREKLWLEKMEKQEIYVRGIKCDISTEEGYKEYLQILETQQEDNIKLGFGNDSKEWSKKDYNVTLRKLNAKSKLQNQQKNT